mmetsp:Transcript_2001/g.3629  ORF Transcript_2001/g.3629 Transcript_2001/m.3629 type:complete len:360 (+) Transcript_2001:2936-4015(+)
MSRIYCRFLIASLYLFSQSHSFPAIGVSVTRQKPRHGTFNTSPFVLLALTDARSNNNNDNLQGIIDTTKDQKKQPQPNLSIEYCTGCRWLLRASWFLQECLTTFENELGSVTLIPSKPPSPGGTFLLKLDNVILWDRTVVKSFPEAKVIKQRIRDQISPQKNLGHSDVKMVGLSVVEPLSSSVIATEKCVECEEEKDKRARDDAVIIGGVQQQQKEIEQELALVENCNLPNVNVKYCNVSKWMMRANWICQEILSTFQDEVRSVTLIPMRSSIEEKSGIFEVSISDRIVWNRKKDGKAFHIEKIKSRIRDIVSPDKDLDFDLDEDQRNRDDDDNEHEDDDDDDIDDDDAADMRSYFGVL